MRILSSLALCTMAAAQLGATNCEGDYILIDENFAGFELWCGDSLCAWKVVRGGVDRTPTWNEADAGVRLNEPGTAIEQFTALSTYTGTCIRFNLIANI